MALLAGPNRVFMNLMRVILIHWQSGFLDNEETRKA